MGGTPRDFAFLVDLRLSMLIFMALMLPLDLEAATTVEFLAMIGFFLVRRALVRLSCGGFGSIRDAFTLSDAASSVGSNDLPLLKYILLLKYIYTL